MRSNEGKSLRSQAAELASLVSLGCQVVPDPSKVIIYKSRGKVSLQFRYNIAQCKLVVSVKKWPS